MGIQIPVIVRDQRSRKANCSGQWAHIIEEKAAATAKVKTLQLSTFLKIGWGLTMIYTSNHS